MNNYEEMRIESDVFATARENFDLLMQRLFKSMEKNNSDEGSITLKVDLQISQDWVPDGKGGSIEINKPVIKHKVSIAVPVKDSMDGKRDTGMRLVYDENLKRYVLKYVSTGGQMNIFDMEQQAENDADIVDSETPAIEGQPTYFLPDNQTDAKSEEPQEEEQNSETDGIMTVPDNVDEETDTDVPSGGYGSTDDSGMPLPFSEDDDYYPYDEPMEE